MRRSAEKPSSRLRTADGGFVAQLERIAALGLVWGLTVLSGCPSQGGARQPRPDSPTAGKTEVSLASVPGPPELSDRSGSSTYWKAPADYGHTYVPAEVDQEAVTAREETDEAPGSYDARLLMPLAVGSSWTYTWETPRATGPQEVRAESAINPLYMSNAFYALGKRMKMTTARHSRARAHHETYNITRRDGDHYFFTISTEPHDVELDMVRDGRYGQVAQPEFCWTWTDNDSDGDGSLVLTESINRTSEVPAMLWPDFLPDESAEAQGDEVVYQDHRMVLFVPFKDGHWGYSRSPSGYIVGPCSMVYFTEPTTVSVPAGEFRGCLETVEYKREKGGEGEEDRLLYKTHTFWAPGTGVVREYQEFPDGTIAFERKLLRSEPGSGAPQPAEG